MENPEQPAPDSALQRALLDHHGWLCGLARSLIAEDRGRTGDRSDSQGAEDLVQDVWAESLRRPPAFHGDAQRMRGWLRGVAKHLRSARLRRDGARLRRERVAARAEADESAGVLAERLRIHRRLVDEVLALEEPFRATLILHHFDGHSAAEIARRMEVSSELVRQRLHRGHRRLRKRLEGEWGGRGDALAARLLPLARVPGSMKSTAGWPALRLGGWGSVGIPLTLLILAVVAWFGMGPRGSSDLAGVEPVRPTRSGIEGGTGSHPGTTPIAVVRGPGTLRRPVAGSEALVVDLHVTDSLAPADAPPIPLSDARVTLISDLRVLAELTTDAEGRCTWSGADIGGRVLVEAPGYVPFCRRLELLRNRHTLDFEAGGVLGGQVFLAGGAPTEPIEVELDLGAPTDALQRLPIEIRRRLLGFGRFLRIPIETDPQGSFSIRGLTPGRPLTLRCPRDLRFSTSTFELFGAGPLGRGPGVPRSLDVLPLRGPMDGMDLELEARPSLEGRIVDPRRAAGHEPGVPSASVQLRLGFATRPGGPSMKTIRTSVTTDAGGWFRLAFDPEDPEGPGTLLGPWQLSELTVGVAGGASVPVEVPSPERGSRDELMFRLGELEFANLDRVRVRVRDREGSPLAGAQVGIEDGPGFSSGEDGVAEVLSGVGPPGTLFVWAQGFVPTSLRWNPELGAPESPLDVSLARAKPWTIDFEGPRGARAPEGRLVLDFVVESEARPWSHFRSERSDGARLEQYSPTSRHGVTHTMLVYRIEGQASFEIEHVEDGHPVTVMLEDRAGTRLAGATIPGDSTALDRRTEIRWDLPECPLEARVVDDEGRPVVGAQVRFEIGDVGLDASTDFRGEVGFGGLHGTDRLGTWIVDAPGYVRRRAVGIRIEPESRRIELQLEPTRPLVVRILDSKGHPAEVESVVSASLPTRTSYLRSPGALPPPVTSERRSGGEWVLEGLPLGEHGLIIRAGGRRYSMVAKVGGGVEEWSLPPLASVELRIPEPWMRKAVEETQLVGFEVELTPLDPGGSSLRRMIPVPGALGLAVDHLVPGAWAIQFSRCIRRPDTSTERIPLGEAVECELVPGDPRVVELGR